MNLIFQISLVIFGVGQVFGVNFPCTPADFGHGSVVCVCNATYCDFHEPVTRVDEGTFVQITSTKSGNRFTTSSGQILNSSPADVAITINRGDKYQSIFGFGGAFTDAAGINIGSLSGALQKHVIESYFGKNGLQYNIGRVPMGGTDFSTRPYSYDDFDNDTLLVNFALAPEDILYKIPYIKQSQKFQGDSLKLITSPWSPPKWMKTNNDFKGRGLLKENFRQTWANYFVRFFEEYAKHNVTFWGLTTQNEPIDGLIPKFPFNSLGWTPSLQRDWIRDHLGPTLRNHTETKDLKIFILDDQRFLLLQWTAVILSDTEAAKYVSGVALHWYGNKLFPVKALNLVHKRYPDLMILGTEACSGSFPGETPVLLGSWERGVAYAEDIIQNLNHYMAGWIDWNLVLDTTGNPNWANNAVDSPIIADPTNDVIYKQPMFYALGHFSKFIPRGSIRISSKMSWWSKSGIQMLACLRPDGHVALVILNTSKSKRQVKVIDEATQQYQFVVPVAPQSINTVIY